MKFISDGAAFGREGWEIATITTARDSHHALYRQSDEILCLGVETAVDGVPTVESVAPILSAIEADLADGGFRGDYGVTNAIAGRFDALGHLSGELRRFANGWADDLGKRVVHVFPCFRCELDPSWTSNRFVGTARGIRNLFDRDRSPHPAVEIMMTGRGFVPPLAEWAATDFKTMLSYVSALADDPDAELKVRNLAGSVLTLDRDTAHDSWRERIIEHACMN